MTSIPDIQLTIQISNTNVPREGFGLDMILSYSTVLGGDRRRYYASSADAVSDGFAASSPEVRALDALFDQNPRPTQVMIGRGDLPPTQRYLLTPARVVASHAYRMAVSGQGVTDTDITVTTVAADLVVESVANGSDTLTITAHGMLTGDGPYRLSNSGGALPAGSAVDTDYWIIKITADTFKLATSKTLALATTPLNLTGDGTGVHTLVRVANDVICAQLVQALNAVVGKNYTATQVTGAGDTDTVHVTASTAGAWFALSVGSVADIGIAQDHADPGVATDLATIADEDGAWYALTTLYNSNAYVRAAAGWIESNARTYYVESCDSGSITTTFSTGVSADTLGKLKDLAYARTHYAYHHLPAQFLGAALAGRLLPLNPGRWTAKYKTLSGITPTTLSATQLVNLQARSGNAYVLRAGRNMTINGVVPNTTYKFIDNVVRLDWFADDFSASLFGILAGNDVVTYTDEDVAKLAGAAKGSIARAVSPQRTVFRADPAPVLVFPKVADEDDSDVEARTYAGVEVTAELAGAVHGITVSVLATF